MNQHAFWKSCEGTQFSSKYYLQELLGVGGFGAVFKADDVVADRCVNTVALKIFNPFQTSDLNAFIQEFKSTNQLHHTHLIKTDVLAEGKLQGAIDSLGLVMELAGEDLAKRLNRSLLTPAEATVLVQHVAAALQYLHSISVWDGEPTKGIVHRDIKPQNIMTVGSGANLTWKVGDLGIVRVLGNQTTTMTTNRQGSPFYVPPEAYSGQVSPAMDMWALGVTIVQALTKQTPFPGPTEAQVMNQVLNEEPRLPTLPEPFKAIVRGCFIKDPKSRWTADRVLAALDPQRSASSPQPISRPPDVPAQYRQESLGSPAAQQSSPVEGLRSEEYTFKTVVNTDAAGRNGQQQNVTVTRWIEDLGNGVLLYLVKIPAGSFIMGSPNGEIDRSDREGPQHRVNFPRDFWIGQFAVTQAQYQTVTGKTPSSFKGNQNPVENVSWDDAVNFCQQLSQSTGRTYRLPTESEWEYACRATTTTPLHFGESITPELGNYKGNFPYRQAAKGTYRNNTTPVGSFPGNLWGLYDMHGNLWEWCLDEWHDNYSQKAESLKRDGSIPWAKESSEISLLSDDAYVLRGGSWNDLARTARSAYRLSYRRDLWNFNVGFRLVLSGRTVEQVLTPLNLPRSAPSPQPASDRPASPSPFLGENQTFDLPIGGGKLEFIAVPGGTLVMEGGHRVQLRPFWMGKYPVTQRQYQAVMGQNPSSFKGNLECPVEMVPWQQAIVFCQKLSKILKQTIDLPSETQWEWAARGATKSKGFQFAGSNNLDEVGWYDQNSGGKTHPVGQKKPNELGLYDMSGNVWEWCKDNWTANPSELPQDVTHLIKGGNSDRRALRGGSWDHTSSYCTSASRIYYLPDTRIIDYGFRVVLF